MNPQDQPGSFRPEDYPSQSQPVVPAAPTAYSAPLAPETSFQQAEDRPTPGPVESGDVLSGSQDQISWTASEFIAHSKSASWYIGLGAGALVLAFFIYAITFDLVSSLVILIGAGLFGVSASRQPRQLDYGLSTQGISIGARIYPYKDFRSFSVVDEGAFSSIVLMPLKRFAPPLSIYYHPDDEHHIVEALSYHLPMQEHKHDLTESLMRKIRF
ncbi:MAG TPA: hypothetical protein VK983_04885 [Candidatus Limnocylindrales bacterium]|nr:hypothetical protein [Candidatus Limnocylindrales bacterium]